MISQRLAKKVGALAALSLGGFLVGAGASIAYADASSSENTFYSTPSYCYTNRAYTNNSAGMNRGGSGVVKSKGTLCNSTATQSIGAAAFLKKTNGSACVTASVAYISAALYSRVAGYNATACGGVGTSLQGSTTTYGYNGTGYSSGSIAAPFQTF